MPRTLLLCFLHGFKGNDDTFRTFPEDLKAQVAKQLPEDNVEAIVYPKYETKGELGQCSASFLEWLKERVMEVRKAHCEKPWPPHDREVGVVLVAHSMGGFVASDTLFLILNERLAAEKDKEATDQPIFPLIQGILTFDTPFNGLARSMFVYGAFSNYQKVSSVFNVMTALSAAPAALGKSAFRKTTASLPSRGSSNPAWQGWQLVAVRTGTVGAIAAGGVAAYMHRQQIMDGMRSMRNLNKESVKEGYQQGVDTISQGLAYINRGNVGRSFEYMSDHFTFVGALLKQQELAQRLERMALLKGIGIHDFYTSLGENGYWSGGYFVPERTFCAIPSTDHQAYHLFSRRVIKKVDDEIQGHMSMFIRDKNDEYEQMTQEASNLVTRWFKDDSPIEDDPKFIESPPEPVEQPVTTTSDGQEVPKTEGLTNGPDEVGDTLTGGEEDDIEILDESPLDITAAAAAIPLPDDDEDLEVPPDTKEAQRSTYMRYLMGVAQQAGTGVISYVPTKMPEMPSGPSFKSFVPRSMPQLPQMPSIPRPGVGMFSRKQQEDTDNAGENAEGEAKTSNADPAATDASGISKTNSDAQLPTDADLRSEQHQDMKGQKSPSLAAS
ncbi:hypothetical protein F5B22DRAFT_640086 [Xylaria bambusicola]|uniref:uncharacterized protein n=1 Tax=Xylaria bambusicola TaxID=326684 RepID=UPI0020073E95|nr:uncharacterized protein F5B22DRAFT_640086 [Xylaria bambusicola]KAI0505230.1 hypothetical protein F5B22DRAFT_640086 [Xylaria bambusicola]